MKTIKINLHHEIPNGFTGIVEFPSGTKKWLFEGIIHRTDGPAIECRDGSNLWYIEGKYLQKYELFRLTVRAIYIGKQKGKYDLDWLRFLTEESIEEFPIIPGMTSDGSFFQALLNNLGITE
ncbi:MAG TPA: hypothetical protein PLP33_07440 [Leptospiraceae bacterium]|nr:hypothetical protein [Leptospiraceae bacterium]